MPLSADNSVCPQSTDGSLLRQQISISVIVSIFQIGTTCLVSLSEEIIERRLHFPPLQIRAWVMLHRWSISEQEDPFLPRVHSAPSVKISRLVDNAINLTHHLVSLDCKAWASHHKMERVLNFGSCAALTQTLRTRNKWSRVSPNLDLELTCATSQFRLYIPPMAHRPGTSLLQVPWHVTHG